MLNLVCYVSLCEGLRAGAGSLSYIVHVDCCGLSTIVIKKIIIYYYYYHVLITPSPPNMSQGGVGLVALACKPEKAVLFPAFARMALKILLLPMHSRCGALIFYTEQNS